MQLAELFNNRWQPRQPEGKEVSTYYQTEHPTATDLLFALARAYETIHVQQEAMRLAKE